MKFRKKPVVIEATNYTEADRDGFLFDRKPLPEGVYIPAYSIHDGDRKVWSAEAYIDTLEGRMHVSLGDWVITGVKGERYACKPDIFVMTYEPAEDQRVPDVPRILLESDSAHPVNTFSPPSSGGSSNNGA